MEIQQSPLYAQYITKLGWKVVRHQGFNMFIKQFPLYGGLVKIQRFTKLLNLDKLIPLLKEHRARRIIVEPDANVTQGEFDRWVTQLSQKFTINKSPYLPTKTSLVDLKPSEDEIFQKFSEAKRRAVRRAIKNNVVIKKEMNIDDLIKIKNKSSGFLGSLTTYGIDKLWHIFAPQCASALLAYRPEDLRKDSPCISQGESLCNSKIIIGGVLLLFWDKTAYYWIAGATREGKKLFAPTLLVWEALKLSKKRGCTQFDFVGVWDERSPNQFHEWKGFTKFKEGFGGNYIYYPRTLLTGQQRGRG